MAAELKVGSMWVRKRDKAEFEVTHISPAHVEVCEQVMLVVHKTPRGTFRKNYRPKEAHG